MTQARFDYLVTGASGQVGRSVLRNLVLNQSTIAVVARRKTKEEVYKELVYKTGLSEDLLRYYVHICLGDLNDTSWELPEASHILNMAGETSLAKTEPNAYWRGNILPAIRLAHHARWVGARSFHQFSSVAVAEFRGEILYESYTPIPDERQLTYSTSKVLTELAVRAILPTAQIIRIGDVVPHTSRIAEDLRNTHWLPILFSYGTEGFNYAPNDYSVWLANGAELADAINILIKEPGATYHALGRKYTWSTFKSHALNLTGIQPKSRVPKWMTDIILYGPEANMVNDNETARVLHSKGFDWSTLGSFYWSEFAKQSVINKGAKYE